LEQKKFPKINILQNNKKIQEKQQKNTLPTVAPQSFRPHRPEKNSPTAPDFTGKATQRRSNRHRHPSTRRKLTSRMVD
jgi:hypothetical protein